MCGVGVPSSSLCMSSCVHAVRMLCSPFRAAHALPLYQQTLYPSIHPSIRSPEYSDDSALQTSGTFTQLRVSARRRLRTPLAAGWAAALLGLHSTLSHSLTHPHPHSPTQSNANQTPTPTHTTPPPMNTQPPKPVL